MTRPPRRVFRKRHPPAGAAPGTLAFGADATPPRIHVMQYVADHVEELDVADAADLRDIIARPGVTWIDVQGLGDETVLRTLADIFSIHPLALEDVVNTPQRPKVEDYETHTLYISRMARVDANGALDIEQVSIFFADTYVLTFQERYGDTLDAVRNRIRNGRGPMRRSGPDYLAYAILDGIVDGYYAVLGRYGDRLEDLEGRVIDDATSTMLGEINAARRDLLIIRRGIWPQRDALNAMLRDGTPHLTEPVKVYLRNCYDHTVQIADVLETYRELAGGLLNTYLSAVANRTNDVMKVLTIMASIFIPLTFMAGIYGMNFDNIPELHFRYGYPILMGLMGLVSVGMLVFFHRRGWLGRPRHDR